VLQPLSPGCKYSVDTQNPSLAFKHASNLKSNAFRPFVQAEHMQQQQADLRPPFSCFKTTNFVPVEAIEEIKEEQLTHTDHSDFSAATASSMERNTFQSFYTTGSEVCIFRLLFILCVLCAADVSR